MVLAVPDLALGPVTADIVPQLKAGAIVLTLDPAAAYAGLLTTRDDVIQAVAHPCHPSIFLQRTTPEEYADTFGGIAAPQDAIAAIESDDPAKQAIVEATVRAIYAPVIDVHWVTDQAARPARADARRDGRLHDRRAPEGGARRGGEHHGRARGGRASRSCSATRRSRSPTACAATTRSATRASSPWTTAREPIIQDDWKKIFRDDELDKNLAQMLHLDKIER